MNTAVDYVQRRELDSEESVAQANGKPPSAGRRIRRGPFDSTQLGFWNAYGFGQRSLVQLLDESLIQGIENSTDRGLNAVRPMPAEIRRTPRIAAPTPSQRR